MNPSVDMTLLKKAALTVRKALPTANPLCAIVLGSGWANALEDFDIFAELEYSHIPGLGTTHVSGHAGKLSLGLLGGKEVLLFQGRRHWYEGEGWTPVISPAFIAKQMGCKHILLTNASGGINSHCTPGSLVVITDHINFLGANPLQGTHQEELGVRFPDMSEVYPHHLATQLMQAGADHMGVYLAASGPSFETPAEINAFRTWGADLVGMSTVPEAIIANALGLEVAGLSCVCNWAAGLSGVALTGDDVIATAKKSLPKMRSVIRKFIQGLPND